MVYKKFYLVILIRSELMVQSKDGSKKTLGF